MTRLIKTALLLAALAAPGVVFADGAGGTLTTIKSDRSATSAAAATFHAAIAAESDD
ncbi:MAG: hypothetical protein WBA25_07930 [Jannaschia sp.]